MEVAMKLKNKELSKHDKKVFTLLKNASKQYEIYKKMSSFEKLFPENDFIEIQKYDWSSPLGLIIKSRDVE